MLCQSSCARDTEAGGCVNTGIREPNWVLWFQCCEKTVILPTFRSGYYGLLQGEDLKKARVPDWNVGKTNLSHTLDWENPTFSQKTTSMRLSLLHYFDSLSLSSTLPRSFVEGVTMYSWLVTVLLLASAAYCSGGQGAVEDGGWGVGWRVHWVYVHWCMCSMIATKQAVTSNDCQAATSDEYQADTTDEVLVNRRSCDMTWLHEWGYKLVTEQCMCLCLHWSF